MHPLLLAMMMLNHQNSDQINENKFEGKKPDVSLEHEQNNSEQATGQKRKRSSDQDDEKPFVIHYSS